MTLTLRFGAAQRSPGPAGWDQVSERAAFGGVILVTGAPDDSAWAEEIARAVLESGHHPYPAMGRIGWAALVAAGLASGVLTETTEHRAAREGKQSEPAARSHFSGDPIAKVEQP